MILTTTTRKQPGQVTLGHVKEKKIRKIKETGFVSSFSPSLSTRGVSWSHDSFLLASYCQPKSVEQVKIRTGADQTGKENSK